MKIPHPNQVDPKVVIIADWNSSSSSTSSIAARQSHSRETRKLQQVGAGWCGIPLPIIILLALFWHH
jgi:hypothetical protein